MGISTLAALSGNHLFSRIHLFKTHLNGLASSGPQGSSAGTSNPQEDGQNARMPDILGVAHHEGVVLEMESLRGSTRFLKLDFGCGGLEYSLGDSAFHK